MTDYERAMVRLRAFELLAGWCSVKKSEDGDEVHKPWSMSERMKYAGELARWAEGKDAAT